MDWAKCHSYCLHNPIVMSDTIKIKQNTVVFYYYVWFDLYWIRCYDVIVLQVQPNILNVFVLWQGWYLLPPYVPSVPPLSFWLIVTTTEYCTVLYDSIANCLRTERPSFFQNRRSRRFSLSLPFLKWKWAVLSHFLFCTFRLPVQSFIKLLIVRTENRTKGSKIELPLIRKI